MFRATGVFATAARHGVNKMMELDQTVKLPGDSGEPERVSR
jgi:hypothetical protein